MYLKFSHVNINLLNRCFSHEQFSISIYSTILHALLHSKSYVLGFYIYSFSQEQQSSISLHLHQHSTIFYFCGELHTLSFNPHLHSHDSCWSEYVVLFTPAIKLYIFRIKLISLFGTQTQAYGSSIVLQIPAHLLTLTINRQKRVLLEFTSLSVALAWFYRDFWFRN